MTFNIIPAIMIGGAGTRLWPLSRSNMPKQFLRLTDELSLFQNTMKRVESPMFALPWLLTNSALVDIVNAQVAEIGSDFSGVILEPMQRGTSAAIGAISMAIADQDPDALILAMPADHVIDNPAVFRDVVARAAPLAMNGNIVTFGIVPTHPETGFGYIRPSEGMDAGDGTVGFKVNQPGGFLEKPNAERAAEFLEAGYLWNAGIFLFKASVMMDELRNYAPDTYAAVEASLEAANVEKVNRRYVVGLDADCFAEAPDDLPIDTAVMEKSSLIGVVPCDDIGWSDIGSLSALWDISAKDADGNFANGSSLFHNTQNSFVHSMTDRRIVLSHVSDLMVIDTEDAVVVIPRDKAQKVKDVVGLLKKEKAPQVNYTRSATERWASLTLDRIDGHSASVSVRMMSDTLFPHALGSAEQATWVMTGGKPVEMIRNGVRVTLTAGTSFTAKRDEVITLQTFSDEATFSVVMIQPDRDFKLAGSFVELPAELSDEQRVA